MRHNIKVAHTTRINEKTMSISGTYRWVVEIGILYWLTNSIFTFPNSSLIVLLVKNSISCRFFWNFQRVILIRRQAFYYLQGIIISIFFSYYKKPKNKKPNEILFRGLYYRVIIFTISLGEGNR